MSLDISLSIEVDTGGRKPYPVVLYDANYTHNVTPMWKRAGVYDALYNSEGKLAKDVTGVLIAGFNHMRKNKEEYLPLNPENGWGHYDTALHFLWKFLKACVAHPNATIGVWK
jgi:hypothetical protein